MLSMLEESTVSIFTPNLDSISDEVIFINPDRFLSFRLSILVALSSMDLPMECSIVSRHLFIGLV